MVLCDGYASSGTRARRKAAAELERVGGVDGNVSNLSIVSFPSAFDPAHGDIEATRIEPCDDERAALAKARRKERGRKRALDRSRRASNPGQYGPSKRQHARAERRAAANLPERAAEMPLGARAATKTGVPQQAYRRDVLSAGYRINRARLAEAAARAAAAKDHRPGAQPKTSSPTMARTSPSRTATSAPGTAGGAKPSRPPHPADSSPR
jgi:hypothetical protein